MLFAGTISTMLRPADGPTEGSHKKSGRKASRKQEGKRQRANSKQKTSSPMPNWRDEDGTTGTERTETDAPRGATKKVNKTHSEKRRNNSTRSHKLQYYKG